MSAVAYADTSFWVSLYIKDTNSNRAQEVVLVNHPLLLTQVVEQELRNAIRLGAFRKQITAAQGRVSLAAFEADQDTQLVEYARLVWQNVFDRAEALSARFAVSHGQRAADILHVASALELGAKVFLTFDHRQARLAKSAGLKVVS